IWYCLSSQSAGSGVNVYVSYDDTPTYAAAYVWNIPLTGGFATLDTTATGTAHTTSSFNTQGTDEYVIASICSQISTALTATQGSGWTKDSTTFGIASHLLCGTEHRTATTAQTGLVGTFTTSGNAESATAAIAFYGTPLSQYTL